MRPRPPPVAALALFFGLGCAAILSGALSLRALILSAALLLPIPLFLRPAPGRRGIGVLLAAAILATLAGGLCSAQWGIRAAADCRFHVPDGWSGSVTGRFAAASRGGAVPFEVTGGLGGGCGGVVRAYVDSEIEVRPGMLLRARGSWRALPRRAWSTAEGAGYLTLESVERIGSSGPSAAAGVSGSSPSPARGAVLRVRGSVQARLQRLFGPTAPVTEALILARREGLDPAVREDFARAGLAHLLAISGFHVGIVAGMLLLLGRFAGAGPRLSPLLAALGAWGYVVAIGSPDAAVRAAIVLGLLALGPVRTRPVSPLGALASAFLAFLVVDPGALGRVGFQLSFAGTAALIVWSRSFARETEEVVVGLLLRLRRARARLGNPRGLPVPEAPEAPEMPGWARAFCVGVGAGLAATLGTLPLVAWHFGQVPLLGIPATLAMGPLVALSIPGIFLCLAVDLVAPPVAAFLAGGVGLLLDTVVGGAGAVAAAQGDAGWVSRWHVVAGAAGLAGAWAVRRVLERVPEGRGGATGKATSARRWARRTILVAGGAAGMLLAPVVGAPGTSGSVIIVAVDVGQGDALAIRSPRGRWILVDTGPRSRSFDAGARRVLPYLRRQGVRRLEALVLTHPDLDHIGGAPAILGALEVRGVLDPGRIAGKAPFEETLEAAQEEGVPWWPAASRSRLEMDGLEIRVLHPVEPLPPSPAVPGGEGDPGREAREEGGSAAVERPGRRPSRLDPAPALEDANDASVVLLVRYGAFQALLTGDAPAAVEEEALRRIDGPVQLLKVGHHGSRTSTSRRFVEALRPEAAILSVGWRNRYGHPHREVLERLRGSGARLYRTDLQGTVELRARDDGSWSVMLPDL